MGAAIGWGALAASSLVLGALLALVRTWPKPLLGHVLAFGAGALIAAVSFELAEQGTRIGGLGAVAVGLAVGGLVYYLLDGAVSRIASGGGRPGRPGRKSGGNAGSALAVGAFLDGIPEQLVLGIGLALGQGVGVGLIVAIFVSNLPEAIGSSTDMRAAGRRERTILRLWIVVAVICALSTVVGYGIADLASAKVKAGINGFAAGALLVMLIDSLAPEARADAGRTAGLATLLGFAIATALSSTS